MTKKPNFAKLMLGICVLAILFIGTWATTRAPLTSAKTTKVSAAASEASIAPTTLAPPAALTDVIELDGDITDTGPFTAAPDDWDTLNCNINGGGHANVKTSVLNDAPGTTIFTQGGSKDISNVTDWRFTDGSVPDKDDIVNASAAKYISGGDSILAFMGDRFANTGTAFIGFWFFKNPVGLDGNQMFTGTHTNGDVLVLSTYTNGGSFGTSKVFEWVSPCTDGTGVGQCPAGPAVDRKGNLISNCQKGGTLCDITGSAPAGSVFSISNGLDQLISCPTTWPYTPKSGAANTIASNDFFEGALNLSAFPELGNECFSTFLVETRSSADVDAQLKDFVLGTFEQCSGNCAKSANPTTICEDPAHPGQGLPVTLTYETSNTGGANLNETLLDNNGTPSNTADDFYISGLSTDATPPACIPSSSPVTVTVPIGQTLRCTRSVTEPVVGGVPTSTTDTLTIHEVNGFIGDCIRTATVTVNPLPAANDTSLTLCETIAGGNTAVFNLTAVESTVTGGAVGVTVSWFSDAALNNPITSPGAYESAQGFAYAQVTKTGCSRVATVTLNVNPRATVNQPGNQSVCNGAMTSAITFTGSAGATFNWTNDTPSIGLAASGSGPIAAFTATNSGTSDVVATITVTPTNANSCVGPSKNFTITVKPTPHVNQPSNQELCDGATTTAVNFSGDVAGTSFDWTNDTPSIGLAASGSGNIGPFTATNAGTSNVVATITVTPTANGCAGPSKTFTITVKPTPTVEVCPVAADADSCTIDNDLLLEAIVSPGGGTVTYSWTKVGSATVLGNGSTLLVTGPGTYRVDITRDGCSAFNSTHVGLCAGCSP